MEYFFLWIVLSIIVAFIGSGKTIGFFLSLLLSLLFSPIIGLIIVALSKSKQTDLLEKELLKMKYGDNYKTDAEILSEHVKIESADSNKTTNVSAESYISNSMTTMYIGIAICIVIGLALVLLNR